MTVGLFNGKRELFDVTSVACGSCASKGENDAHAMPLRILNGSFDYQDHSSEQQPQAQPLPQPLPQVSQSQFVNQPVTKNEEKAPFFGQIVPIWRNEPTPSIPKEKTVVRALYRIHTVAGGTHRIFLSGCRPAKYKNSNIFATFGRNHKGPLSLNRRFATEGHSIQCLSGLTGRG